MPALNPCPPNKHTRVPLPHGAAPLRTVTPGLMWMRTDVAPLGYGPNRHCGGRQRGTQVICFDLVRREHAPNAVCATGKLWCSTKSDGAGRTELRQPLEQSAWKQAMTLPMNMSSHSPHAGSCMSERHKFGHLRCRVPAGRDLPLRRVCIRSLRRGSSRRSLVQSAPIDVRKRRDATRLWVPECCRQILACLRYSRPGTSATDFALVPNSG